MRTLILAVAFVFSASAVAQSVKSTVQTSTGIDVTLYSDEFADRYEYTSPSVEIPGTQGIAMVAYIKSAGTVRGPEIIGSVVYRGEWRRYNSAILRGGKELSADFGSRDVISCRGSRYSSGCLLSEQFRVRLTTEEWESVLQSGKLEMQLRAYSGPAVMVTIPARHYRALLEAAGLTAVEPTPVAPSESKEPTVDQPTPRITCPTCN